MRFNNRVVNAILVLASIVGMSFALYLEHVQGLEPCPLCVFQRLGLMAVGIVALVAFIHHPKAIAAKRIYAFLATLGALWSMAVAGRHVYIQHLPADQVPSCGPGLNYLVDALPLKSVLQQVLTGSGECAKIDWTFLGQSLPVWSLLFFMAVFAVCLWQLLRPYRSVKVKK